MFNAFDTDNSGAISKEEFIYMTCVKMEALEKKEALALVKVLDTDNDGR